MQVNLYRPSCNPSLYRARSIPSFSDSHARYSAFSVVVCGHACSSNRGLDRGDLSKVRSCQVLSRRSYYTHVVIPRRKSWMHFFEDLFCALRRSLKELDSCPIALFTSHCYGSKSVRRWDIFYPHVRAMIKSYEMKNLIEVERYRGEFYPKQNCAEKFSYLKHTVYSYFRITRRKRSIFSLEVDGKNLSLWEENNAGSALIDPSSSLRDVPRHQIYCAESVLPRNPMQARSTETTS
jgi:hypothetical protein